ncbi:hypothetical protein [Paraburkholderia sp. A1RO-5L]|uniref:hypothetical protein n=1 Tax=Paraburkholderia sp. A1RO-5L TaxID=3028370 RepID=UPI003B76D0A8
MDYDQLDEIERPLKEHWEERMGDKLYALVSPVWEDWILPSLKKQAREAKCTQDEFREWWIRAMRLMEDLFESLHFNYRYRFEHGPEDEIPRFYWRHQQFDFLKANDAKGGIYIEKADMLKVAAEYLSRPEIRTNMFDWLLLDSIVFAELDAFTSHIIGSKISTSLAAAGANGNHTKYFALVALFGAIGIALSYLTPPALAILAFTKGHNITGWSIAGLWGVSLIWTLIGVPTRWKVRRKNKELLTNLNDLYRILGDSTISPRVLKDALDKAAASGVVLDGAVFSIVDRMIARDATTFVPTSVG